MADKQSTRKQGTKFCYHCGSLSHLAPACRHLETVCKSCGKKGHLAAVCQSKPHKSTPATQTKYVEDGSDSDAEAPVFTLSSPRTPPIRVCVNLAGQEVMMEVDAGAAVSLISVEQWFGLQLSHQMEPSKTACYVPIQEKRSCRSHTHEAEGNTTTCHS